jgi:hypothetical protein
VSVVVDAADLRWVSTRRKKGLLYTPRFPAILGLSPCSISSYRYIPVPGWLL